MHTVLCVMIHAERRLIGRGSSPLIGSLADVFGDHLQLSRDQSALTPTAGTPAAAAYLLQSCGRRRFPGIIVLFCCLGLVMLREGAGWRGRVEGSAASLVPRACCSSCCRCLRALSVAAVDLSKAVAQAIDCDSRCDPVCPYQSLLHGLPSFWRLASRWTDEVSVPPWRSPENTCSLSTSSHPSLLRPAR